MNKVYYIGFVANTRMMKLKKDERPTFEEPIQIVGYEDHTFVCSLVIRDAETRGEAVRKWVALAPEGAVLRFIGSFSEENFDEPVCQKRWVEEWKNRKIYKA